ncbi:MAG TPA: NUDIX hydrolase [Steroidobacteraceae bacterium]|jgi:8-oxo-dGTP pyrophosphatase MutT (NUDIX family)|nr:NUDIX hydrolase [Steroidobacteraceae bacterium]
MTWKPDVTVAAIVEQDGRFLLVEEHVGNRLVINQPAGHLEVNESFTTAVIRETLEETGWTFVPESLTGVYLWQHPERSVSFLRVTFCGKAVSHDPERPLDHGIKRTLWLSRDELQQKQNQLRSPMVIKCIDDYLTGARHPLSVLTHLAATKIAQSAS